jgi:hypothetical protein
MDLTSDVVSALTVESLLYNTAGYIILIILRKIAPNNYGFTSSGHVAKYYLF